MKEKLIMSLLSTIKIALKAICANKLRAFLTMLGIIIGVVSLLAAVIPMMIISLFVEEDVSIMMIAASIMMIIFAFGISCIVYVVTINQGYKRILMLK